jgi:hypothetical protein
MAVNYVEERDGWKEGHYAEEWLDSGCEDKELREFWEV